MRFLNGPTTEFDTNSFARSWQVGDTHRW